MATKKNIFISFGSNGVVYAIQFLTTVFVSRILPPEQIGIFSVSIAAVSILQGLREFGIGNYLVQEKNIDVEKIRTVFAFALIVGWGIGAVLFLTRYQIARFYKHDEMANIVEILSFSFLAFPFGLPATGMLLRERRFFDIARIAVASALTNLAVTVYFALNGYGAAAPAIGTLASSIVLAIVALWFWPKHLLLLPSFSHWPSIAKFGLRSSGTSLILRIGISLPELIIGRVIGIGPVALFTRGRNLPNLFEQMLVSPLQSAMGPELAAQLRANQPISSQSVKIVEAITILGWPALAFVTANASDVIETLFGERWTGAIPVLQACCLAKAISILNGAVYPIYDAKGAVAERLRNEFFILLVSVPIVVLSATYSLQAIIWAQPFLAVLSLFVHSRFYARETNITGAQLVPKLFRSALVAALIFASTILIGKGLAQFIRADNTIVHFTILSVNALIVGIILLTVLKLQNHFVLGPFTEANTTAKPIE